MISWEIIKNRINFYRNNWEVINLDWCQRQVLLRIGHYQPGTRLEVLEDKQATTLLVKSTMYAKTRRIRQSRFYCKT